MMLSFALEKVGKIAKHSLKVWMVDYKVQKRKLFISAVLKSRNKQLVTRGQNPYEYCRKIRFSKGDFYCMPRKKT